MNSSNMMLYIIILALFPRLTSPSRRTRTCRAQQRPTSTSNSEPEPDLADYALGVEIRNRACDCGLQVLEKHSYLRDATYIT